MGFVPGLSIQIESFLTENGANQLMASGISDIKYFSISDDAANYSTSLLLGLNEMFTLGGKFLVNDKQLSVLNSTRLESKIFVDNSAETFKTFESDSGQIFLEQNINFKDVINQVSISQYIINPINNLSSHLNWIKDLKLPYGSTDSSIWGTTYSNGGYSDTSISDMFINTALDGMTSNSFATFVIDGSQHAYIDGKSIKFSIPFFSGSVDCYSSYLTTGMNASFYDSQITDASNYLTRFGGNAVLLFSDYIQRPNNDATKSWATGYGYNSSPYSQGGKHLANFVSGVNNKDKAVGIAFLDKGVIIIFNPILYNGYDKRTISTISLTNNNIIRRTVANFICELPIGKFFRSQNSTFSTGNPIRVSSIGLYNSNKELIAIGRFDAQVEKNMGQRLTILVKIVI